MNIESERCSRHVMVVVKGADFPRISRGGLVLAPDVKPESFQEDTALEVVKSAQAIRQSHSKHSAHSQIQYSQ